MREIQQEWTLMRVIRAHERLDIKAELEIEIARLQEIQRGQ